MTKVYHFDSTTGAYLGERNARPDPMDPGKWLVPAWATLDVPMPPQEGMQRHYLIPDTDVPPATQHGQTGAWELRPLPEAA